MFTENGITFSDDTKKIIIKVDNSKISSDPDDPDKSYEIPDGVECIGQLSFYGCTNLTSLVIPKSVKRIEPQAFYFCSNLTEVTLSDSLEYVGLEAFAYCAIETLNIAKGTERITALMDITQDIDFRPDDMKIELGLTDELGQPLENKNILKKIVILDPESITSIEDYAFKNCTEAEIVAYENNSVVLTDNIGSIGRYAFYNTSYYNTDYNNESPVLYIDGHLIDANIDDERHAPEVYEIPDNTKTIADSAFRNCPGLTRVIIPESVWYIGDSAFRNCPDLQEVVIRAPGDDVTDTATPPDYEPWYDKQGFMLFDSNGYALYVKKAEDEQTLLEDDQGAFEMLANTKASPERPPRLGEHVFAYCNKNLTIICSGEILDYLQAQGKYTVVNFTEYNKNNII